MTRDGRPGNRVPPASCSDAVRQAARNLTALGEDLKDAPLDERLSALAALHRAFGDLQLPGR